MKKGVLYFFLALSVLYTGGVISCLYALIQALISRTSFVGEMWTLLTVVAIWIKLLDLTAKAVKEAKSECIAWKEYTVQEPAKRSLYALLSIAFFVVSPLLYICILILNIDLAAAIFWIIPMPSVLFLYLALFGKPDLRPLRSLMDRKTP